MAIRCDSNVCDEQCPSQEIFRLLCGTITCCLLAGKLASRQHYLFDKCLLLYVQSCTPDDGRKDRPKHVECHSKIK